MLEAFSAERPELDIERSCGRGGLDPGTAFRMLNTLVMLGYVNRIPDTNVFG